jgi:hypothetical protein
VVLSLTVVGFSPLFLREILQRSCWLLAKLTGAKRWHSTPLSCKFGAHHGSKVVLWIHVDFIPPNMYNVHTLVSTCSQNIAIDIQLAKDAKTPLVVVPFPQLVIILERKYRDRAVVTSSTVKTRQCRAFVVHGSYCGPMGASAGGPTRPDLI